MMLADENQSVKAACPAIFHDLLRIEMLWSEKRGILAAVSPFLVGVGIQSEMNDGIAAARAVMKHARRRTPSCIKLP